MIFVTDQRSWSQAVKTAVSREPSVKINAAKPPRKSWLTAIFMTIGLPIHGKLNTREQHEAMHKLRLK